MTVCLTGDVHHMSLETRDQEYMDRTEVEAAIEYAEIAGEYDVPVTLFVTGKAAEEEPGRVKKLAAMENVEIGGHNYWAFGTPLHKLFRGVTGSWHGPRWFQAWEIGKTVEIFEELGVEIRSWRDHAYRHDENTIELLSKAGISHFSDVVNPEGETLKEDELTMVPINTPPDHEHVYHAFRTPQFVAEDDFEGPFGSESHEVEGWLDWTLGYMRNHEESSLVSTVLAHPSCMSLADEMESFEYLCRMVREEYSPANIHSV